MLSNVGEQLEIFLENTEGVFAHILSLKELGQRLRKIQPRLQHPRRDDNAEIVVREK